jgi:hypothetical protein
MKRQDVTDRWIARRGLAVAVAAGVLFSSAGGILLACNVPVYRYALERWKPDPYRVTLLHRGPLSDEQRTLIKPLEEPPSESRGQAANVAFRTVDVSELDEATFKQLVATEKDPQLPWLVVQYPAHLRIEAPVWRGPMDSSAIARLAGSSIREELVRRLAEGQTAVWLLLETGQAEVDNEVAARIEGELGQLQQELKLPQLTESPEDNLLSAAPLKIQFSVLRVPRGDADQALVEMLIRSESDLADRSDPMVFPVFGRGRALFPLVGPGITKENIHESAAFLVGPCSCQVKELNPGFDLLLTAEWESLLSLASSGLASLPPESPPASTEPVLVPIPTGGAAAATPAAAPHPTAAASTAHAESPQAYAPYPISRSLVVAGMIGLLVLVGAASVASILKPPAAR